MNRQRLGDHIYAALLDLTADALIKEPAARDEIADVLETVHEHIRAAAVVGHRRGRIDTRSLRIDCYLGPDPLVSVRARHLLDEHGRPVDSPAAARELLLQLGYGIPDSPAGLDGAG